MSDKDKIEEKLEECGCEHEHTGRHGHDEHHGHSHNTEHESCHHEHHEHDGHDDDDCCCEHDHYETASHFGDDLDCGCGHCHHHGHDEHDADHDHGHSHSHSHGHDDDEEEEMSLKKILVAFCFFVLGLVFEHVNSSFLQAWLPASAPALQNLDGVLASLGGLNQTLHLVSIVFFFVSFLLVGKGVVIGALKNLVKGAVFDEQFLMTVASLGAIFIGEMPEAVAVMLFYQVGEWFQDYAVDKSRKSIKSLMEIRPDKAVILKDGKEISVKAEEVQIGDILVVRPGERIPVDGIVISGKSFVDNSALTGESVPLEVFEGNQVYSGAVNKDAVIQLRAEKKSEDSAASRILELVEESSSKKTKAERFITRFAKVYTPIVCSLAVAVALLPPLVLKFFFPETFLVYGWSTWINRALIFLVVSCPCAIVISVPLTFFAGIGASGKQGILVKGSAALDSLSKVRTVVFDKTGTLTKGVFEVTAVHPVPGKIQADELVALAAHAETYSNHPVSKSLKKAHAEGISSEGTPGKKECCSLVNISDAQEISGQGIRVNLDGKTVLAGNERLMQNNGVSGFEKCTKDGGGTVVHVAIDGEYCGHIVISDVTKEDSALAVQKLKNCGVKRITMLTGDKEEAAKKTAEELGITDYFAELLPEDKVRIVEEIMGGETVAFAGDGINDAPVLARVDVGIAMGAIGTDAAIESADVVIMNDSPALIAGAILNAKKTISIVKQNIAVSLGVKILIMVLGAAGIANMWLAVFGDTGVALIAVLNALRALKYRKK